MDAFDILLLVKDQNDLRLRPDSPLSVLPEEVSTFYVSRGEQICTNSHSLIFLNNKELQVLDLWWLTMLTDVASVIENMPRCRNLPTS